MAGKFVVLGALVAMSLAAGSQARAAVAPASPSATPSAAQLMPADEPTFQLAANDRGGPHAGGGGRPMGRPMARPGGGGPRPGFRPGGGGPRPAFRPGGPGRPHFVGPGPGRPGFRPGPRPGFRPGPGFHGGRPWVVRRWYHRPYFGTIIGGVALGTILAVTAGIAPPPPDPSLCWYWTDPSQTQGYWDYCQ